MASPGGVPGELGGEREQVQQAEDHAGSAGGPASGASADSRARLAGTRYDVVILDRDLPGVPLSEDITRVSAVDFPRAR